MVRVTTNSSSAQPNSAVPVNTPVTGPMQQTSGKVDAVKGSILQSAEAFDKAEKSLAEKFITKSQELHTEVKGLGVLVQQVNPQQKMVLHKAEELPTEIIEEVTEEGRLAVHDSKWKAEPKDVPSAINSLKIIQEEITLLGNSLVGKDYSEKLHSATGTRLHELHSTASTRYKYVTRDPSPQEKQEVQEVYSGIIKAKEQVQGLLAQLVRDGKVPALEVTSPVEIPAATEATVVSQVPRTAKEFQKPGFFNWLFSGIRNFFRSIFSSSVAAG